MENVLLNRATLFSADLRGAKLSGVALRDVKINEETQFLGNHSGDNTPSAHTAPITQSQSCCVYDPRYKRNNRHEDIDKAQELYQSLEDLGDEQAFPQLQKNSSTRYQDLRRYEHRRTMLGRKEQKHSSLRKRAIAGIRYIQLKLAEVIRTYSKISCVAGCSLIVTWCVASVLSVSSLSL